jgi:hypothetical protein
MITVPAVRALCLCECDAERFTDGVKYGSKNNGIGKNGKN